MKIHTKLEADSVFVAALNLSDLRLMNNQQYPWLILVPRVEGAIELIDLSQAQQHELMDEISRVSAVLKSIYEPDKLNVATIGNIVRQLHIHVVARYRSDPAWPSPVWGYPGTPYTQENLDKTLERLKMLSF
jgi:diadenosine tetraphosphate (Ap4A) HIT family hydrolase